MRFVLTVPAITLCTATLLAFTGASELPYAHPSLAAASDTGAESQLWLPPVGEPLRIHAFFDLPNGPYRAGHRGIDITTVRGATVHAPAAGVVSFVGFVVDRPVLSIRVDSHTVFSLEAVDSDLQLGDAVARGEPVGVLAAEARCHATCLHLGVRIDGNYVNPLRFFRSPPQLVPWEET